MSEHTETLKVWRCSECGEQERSDSFRWKRSPELKGGKPLARHWHGEQDRGKRGEFVPAEEVEVIPAADHERKLDLLEEAQDARLELEGRLVKVEAERDEAEDKAKDGPWKTEWFELESRAAVVTQQLGGLREGLRAEIGLLETTATNAGSEAISLGAEGNLDGEKEAKLIEAIANNSVRSLTALLDTYLAGEGGGG